MIKIFRPPQSKFSFDRWISQKELQIVGISLVNELSQADWIATSTYSEIEPYILEYGTSFKYFVWCPEPIWQLADSFDYSGLEASVKKRGIDIVVMSYLDDIFCDFSKLFLAPWYLGSFSLQNIRERKNKVCFLGVYRDDNFLSINPKSTITSLNALRSKLAIDLYSEDYIDIYGKSWPLNISLGESREGNWIDEKLKIVANYKYCLSIENTCIKNYVSEKIWQPISVGVLPIYYGAYPSSIYEIFPKISFFDASEFNDVSQLVSALKNMSIDEYLTRIEKCKVVLDKFLCNKNLYSDTKAIIARQIANKLIDLT